MRLAGFAGALGYAAKHAGGHGRGDRLAPVGAAVQEVAHDAEQGVFWVTPVLGVVFLAQEGCELARVEESHIRLVGSLAGDKGEGDAFPVAEKGGAVCATKESIDFHRPRIEWVAIPSFCGTFVSFRLVRSAHREPDIFSGLPDASNRPMRRNGRVSLLIRTGISNVVQAQIIWQAIAGSIAGFSVEPA